MPRAKKTTPATVSAPTMPKRPTIHVIDHYLSVVFHVVWIVIGAFFLLLIFSQVRQGALSSLLSNPSPQQSVPSQTSAPSETNLPGIGMVNISCVQQTLSPDELQKIVQAGDASNLTAAEKAKLAPCVTQAESSTPSASSKPTK
ncbi:MAG TPA: hypothetical protein VLE91_02165 [Candidatus Saccharimonadales bacterium]|nr:hypothetical protein [Candidatus Saccharimonadales bacterium]